MPTPDARCEGRVSTRPTIAALRAHGTLSYVPTLKATNYGHARAQRHQEQGERALRSPSADPSFCDTAYVRVSMPTQVADQPKYRRQKRLR
ncbi:hypothetical protein BgiBS90_038146 [Biomphalaria glabrata]|nr:hypothetical protein BgiBS90_038146 [Biomphalaria glabrata]